MKAATRCHWILGTPAGGVQSHHQTRLVAKAPYQGPLPPLTHDTAVVREWHERGAAGERGGADCIVMAQRCRAKRVAVLRPVSTASLLPCVSFASPCDGCHSGTRHTGGSGQGTWTIPPGTQLPLIYLSNDPAVLSLWPCFLPLSTVVVNTFVDLCD